MTKHTIGKWDLFDLSLYFQLMGFSVRGLSYCFLSDRSTMMIWTSFSFFVEEV